MVQQVHGDTLRGTFAQQGGADQAVAIHHDLVNFCRRYARNLPVFASVGVLHNDAVGAQQQLGAGCGDVQGFDDGRLLVEAIRVGSNWLTFISLAGSRVAVGVAVAWVLRWRLRRVCARQLPASHDGTVLGLWHDVAFRCGVCLHYSVACKACAQKIKTGIEAGHLGFAFFQRQGQALEYGLRLAPGCHGLVAGAREHKKVVRVAHVLIPRML